MHIRSIAARLKLLSISSAILVLSSCTALSAGGAAFADDNTPCTPPNGGTGVNYPTGADASTFTYQCSGTYAGEWTNQYYAYNPATGQRERLYDPDYSYDCTAGRWTMTTWNYSPSTHSFVSSRVTPASAPDLPTGCPAPVASAPGNPSSSGSSNSAGSPASGSGATVNSSGPGSSNSAGNSVTLNGTTTNNTGINMGNNLSSNATTGDTLVVGNTTGGSAASGSAQSVANVANLLQTTTNVFGPDTAVFTANINGDVNGDFMFDPSAILASGPDSSNQVGSNLQVNTNATNNVNAQINNTIDVGATSGNATVASNTNGGNATTGDATAIVNLMNLINSTVAAGQSFVGTININGDLNGDILLPPSLLNQLLASTGPGSSNSSNASLVNSSTTTNNVTETTANNITSSAVTGNATVADNTHGGNATSGTSGTNVTLLNLTGSNIIGKNDLLVFVNVLGKWVGMIMNTPAGTTAAELGSGISNSGPESSNAATTTLANTSTTTNAANLGITNDVNVHAQSGDAAVTDNTTGGNARSGDAHTAVNILNLTGSNLSLSDWFGVLFINVFGIWNGSFGVNTSAGDPVTNPGNPTNNAVQAAAQQRLVSSFQRFARFVASNSTPASGRTSSSGDSAAVLGTATTVSKKVSSPVTATSSNPTPDNQPHASFLMPAIGIGIAGVLLLVSERDRLVHHKK